MHRGKHVPYNGSMVPVAISPERARMLLERLEEKLARMRECFLVNSNVVETLLSRCNDVDDTLFAGVDIAQTRTGTGDNDANGNNAAAATP